MIFKVSSLAQENATREVEIAQKTTSTWQHSDAIWTWRLKNNSFRKCPVLQVDRNGSFQCSNWPCFTRCDDMPCWSLPVNLWPHLFVSNNTDWTLLLMYNNLQVVWIYFQIENDQSIQHPNDRYVLFADGISIDTVIGRVVGFRSMSTSRQ